MIAVDTLVHNFLVRTGVLNRASAGHPYGPQCYGPRGCAAVLLALSQAIDARQFNNDFPKVFPRYIQHAIWRYCAGGEFNVCNGNRIDDDARCRNGDCRLYCSCVGRPGRSIGLGRRPDQRAQKYRSRCHVPTSPSQCIRRGGDSKIGRCRSNQKPDFSQPMGATAAPISLPSGRVGKRSYVRLTVSSAIVGVDQCPLCSNCVLNDATRRMTRCAKPGLMHRSKWSP